MPIRDDGSLRLGVVADTHSQPHEGTKRHLGALRPDAILHAGDIGDLAVLAESGRRWRRSMRSAGTSTGGPRAARRAAARRGGARRRAAAAILVTHIAVDGPRLRADVARMARAEGASLVVCGHSHVPFIGRDRTGPCQSRVQPRLGGPTPVSPADRLRDHRPRPGRHPHGSRLVRDRPALDPALAEPTRNFSTARRGLAPLTSYMSRAIPQGGVTTSNRSFSLRWALAAVLFAACALETPRDPEEETGGSGGEPDTSSGGASGKGGKGGAGRAAGRRCDGGQWRRGDGGQWRRGHGGQRRHAPPGRWRRWQAGGRAPCDRRVPDDRTPALLLRRAEARELRLLSHRHARRRDREDELPRRARSLRSAGQQGPHRHGQREVQDQDPGDAGQARAEPPLPEAGRGYDAEPLARELRRPHAREGEG